MNTATRLRQWIYQKLKGYRKNENTVSKIKSIIAPGRIFATFIIALSGFILYSDKALVSINFRFDIPEKFSDAGMDFQTYIWLLSQTISPLLIIIGSVLRPYFLSYIIPIYCYCLQLYFIFFDYKIIDDHYIEEYAVGSSIMALVLIYFIRRIRKNIVNKKIIKSEVFQNRSRYTEIKMLLNSVEEYYNDGKIDPEMYLSLVKNIEKDFLAIEKKLKDEDIKKLLNDYITKLS